jgi:hypothetical protein
VQKAFAILGTSKAGSAWLVPKVGLVALSFSTGLAALLGSSEDPCSFLHPQLAALP